MCQCQKASNVTLDSVVNGMILQKKKTVDMEMSVSILLDIFVGLIVYISYIVTTFDFDKSKNEF